MPAELQELASLLARRNELDRKIGAVVGRPAAVGHLGEFIAAGIFGIVLEQSASARGFDGRFVGGPLAGQTVNVKWYPAFQRCLDLKATHGPDVYLVLAGPRATNGTSRDAFYPLVIETVYVFDAAALLSEQRTRGVQVGTASSVLASQWTAAEVYPTARSPLLALNADQRAALALFRL